MADIIDALSVALIPATLEQLLFMLISFSASLTFFKELDDELQKTEWFTALGEDTSIKGILKYRAYKVALDALHHWWAGLALIIYAPWPFVSWVGSGLLIADLPDMIRRLGDIKQIVGENLTR